MLRVWIFVGIILLLGVLLGIWLANRNRRLSGSSSGSSRPSGSGRPTGPDDDAQFLRSINIDPESLTADDDEPDPGDAKDNRD